jgi:hypothetical protein
VYFLDKIFKKSAICFSKSDGKGERERELSFGIGNLKFYRELRNREFYFSLQGTFMCNGRFAERKP